MGWITAFRQFLAARARERRARRLLDEAFLRPDIETQSALRPDHRGRAVMLGHESGPDGAIVAIRFGIVRHPKPLRVPGVSHEVIEIYRYDVPGRRITVETSRNITLKGRPGSGATP